MSSSSSTASGSSSAAATPFATLPGVFAPISDSHLLAAAIRREPSARSGRVLDLCTGSGIQAISAATLGAEATAVDVSYRALVSVRLNARRAGCRVRTVRGRLFDPVAGERFDLIVSNPPYVPAPSDRLPRRGPSRAWVGGRDGRLLLDEICDRAIDHLDPGGAVLLTHSSIIGEQRTVDRLERAGCTDVAVVERVRGPLGPLMAAQQALGTIPSQLRWEDVVVVRAQAPR